MKPLPFSLHNSVLKQVAKEDVIAWAKSDSYMPPIPEYKAVKIPFTRAVREAFSKEVFSFCRP